MTPICAMEAASYLAGEPHSDSPKCVCPVIAAFVRTWQDNLDNLDDKRRQTLIKPLIPLVIGTRSTPDVQDARAIAVADWSIRHVLPTWLRLTSSLADHADALAALPELTTLDAVNAARIGPVAAAWDAAGDAAWAAAGAAARAAAGAAARDAAWDAARAAAWDAARAAARAVLAPTVAQLQADSADLIRRLVAIGADK